jgi:hypothetical protein
VLCNWAARKHGTWWCESFCVCQCLMVMMHYDSKWELTSGIQSVFSIFMVHHYPMCTVRQTEYFFVRRFNGSLSKNSHRINIYFNMCWNTFDDWKVSTQEKLVIITKSCIF